jgi:hypothetical protein
MSAANLISEFNENENAANNKYLGKIIEVTGPVAEVNNEQDTVINISLGSNEKLRKVSCRMDSRHFSEVKKYSEGNIITIKGTCDGFLMDVELSRCVISKDQ